MCHLPEVEAVLQEACIIMLRWCCTRVCCAFVVRIKLLHAGTVPQGNMHCIANDLLHTTVPCVCGEEYRGVTCRHRAIGSRHHVTIVLHTAELCVGGDDRVDKFRHQAVYRNRATCCNRVVARNRAVRV